MKNSLSRFSLVLLVLLVVTSLSAVAQDGDFEDLRDTAIFNEADCPFPTPAAYTVECGQFVVPQNRQDPETRTITLGVAIIRSQSENPAPDPVVYLVGGPGGSVLANTRALIYAQFAPFLEQRDVILIDQRGTGLSIPRLYCPEVARAVYGDIAFYFSPEDETRLWTRALEICRENMESVDIDLGGYNSAESAADLAALRQVLGYDEWNLYGVSYGSRLALTTMREHPEGLRSVILDSVYPPQVNIYTDTLGNFLRALDVLFAACEADADCNAAYPDLESVFWELYERLNDEPVEIELTWRNQQVPMYIDGNLVLDFVFNWLYDITDIVDIPLLIYAMNDGDWGEPAGRGLDVITVPANLDMGMHYAVQCSEEVPFTDAEALENLAETYPQLATYIEFSPQFNSALFDMCDQWGGDAPNAVENEPVSSDVPALLLAGEFDPITPPAWAQETSELLPNSFVYTVNGVGHGVIRSNTCALNIALDFLDDPTSEPDTACLAEQPAPDFHLPGEPR